MIQVSEDFLYDCVDPDEELPAGYLRDQAIEEFLKKTLGTEVTCDYEGFLRRLHEPIWTIHLLPKYETLFRIKYSEYIV